MGVRAYALTPIFWFNPAMAKTRTQHVCQQCGRRSPRQMGRCPQCGSWNSMVEEIVTEPAKSKRHAPRGLTGRSTPRRLHEINDDVEERLILPIGEFARVLGGGIVPGSVVLIGGDPGIGKCVTADTRVLDSESGDYLPIREWATHKRNVLAVDKQTLRLRSTPISAFYERGIHSIVEVKTKLGRTLRCTSNHPLLTTVGWKPISELTIGSRIAAPRALPYFGREAVPDVEVKLVAYILTDGSVQFARALWGVKNRCNNSWADWARGANVSYKMLHMWQRGECVPSQAELQRLANAVNVPLTDFAPEARNIAEKKTPVARFLEDIGLRYKKAADKAVPDYIFRLPADQLAFFLKAIFTYDGSVFINQRGLPGVSYSTNSHRLAKDVQHLLLRFGLVTKLRTKRSRVNGKDYTSYEVTLQGVRDTQHFVTTIGIMGRDKICTEIVAMALPNLSSTHRDTVPTGKVFWDNLKLVSNNAGLIEIPRNADVTIRNRRHERPLCRSTVERLANAYPNPHLQALAFGDIYWDEIEGITPAGKAKVYDLSVPESENFVANDLIIHNSTLLLETALRMTSQGTVLYVSGEESERQIKMRADRLLKNETKADLPILEDLFLVTETNLSTILEHVTETKPRLLIIDSIQTVYLPELESSAGSVSQVRESASRLRELAKSSGIAVFIIGHVTKEGTIAGPRVLEHIVDTVLYLEGDQFQRYRLLRSVKNRFGAASEVGVFEMGERGMVEITNPSEAFLAERMINAPGSTIAVTMEGTRPLLVEIQGLTSHTSFGNPRRTPNGVDFNRLLLTVAVLSRRVGLRLGEQDVFVNVVGGLKINEPAADLAVAAAIASSVRDQPVRADTVLISEIGLSGELRMVGQMPARLREAANLGFKTAIVPRRHRRGERWTKGIEILQARSLRQALDHALIE